jgi:hypothetical protein
MDIDLGGKSNGVKYIISKNTNPNYDESKVLATELQKNISSVFSKSNGVETRKHSIWVLEESKMPAVIFECGFISNAPDLEIVKSKPVEIAEKILSGATAYLLRKDISEKVVFDKEPQFTCKKIDYDEQNKVMTLTENVSFKNDKFEFANAGKVVYNEKTKKLTKINRRSRWSGCRWNISFFFIFISINNFLFRLLGLFLFNYNFFYFGLFL